MTVPQGELLNGLRNPSLRSPAMGWERVLQQPPDATGVGNGTPSAMRNAPTPTQGTPGAGFLKQTGAHGTDAQSKTVLDNTSTAFTVPAITPATTRRVPGRYPARSALQARRRRNRYWLKPAPIIRPNLPPRRGTTARLGPRSALLKKYRAFASLNPGLLQHNAR